MGNNGECQVESSAKKDSQCSHKQSVYTFDSFSKLAGGIQALVTTLGIIIGGIWALVRFDALLEAQIATHQAEKLEAEAIIARRGAESQVVLNIDISAKQISPQDNTNRWVMIEITLRNSGNTPYKLDIKNNTRFYIARVNGIDDNGVPEYDYESPLKFDYPDKTIEWFMLRPGAEIDRFRTIQKADLPGLYVARFSAGVPDASIGRDREYSAQVFFHVN